MISGLQATLSPAGNFQVPGGFSFGRTKQNPAFEYERGVFIVSTKPYFINASAASTILSAVRPCFT